MDLSIVIVSYNTKEMLRACLNSLEAGTEGLTVETFVVDNNSPDGSAEMVRTEFPQVRLIANTGNTGFTRANNQALRLTVGRNVVILNPDTEADPGALTVLVRYLDEHPDVGAVGPMLLNTDGSLQPNGVFFPTIRTEFLGHTGLWKRKGISERMWHYHREDFDSVCEVDVVTGACMMVRHTVMDRAGMLDEDFFMFYEETEWCWRIKVKLHYKILYIPQSRIVHHWMGSVRQQNWVMTRRLFRSMVTYHGKTGGPGGYLGALCIAAIGILKNEIIHTGVAVKRQLRAARVIC